MTYQPIFQNGGVEGMATEPHVDRMLGNAYQVVRYVAQKMHHVQRLSTNMQSLVATSNSLTEVAQVAAVRAEVVALYANLTELVSIYPNMTALLAVQADMTDLLALPALTAEDVRLSTLRASAALASQEAALLSADNSADSATQAEAAKQALDNRFYPGVYGAAPATRPDGSARQVGDQYSSSTQSYIFRAGAWSNFEAVALAKAGEAVDSAVLAQKWAVQTNAEVVAGQGFGAKKYSQDATTQAGLAATAKAQAELARDASLVNGGIKYTTEALGRAAVADGANFMVQGSGDVAAYEYRRTSSTVSVLIATYPSASITSQTVNSGKVFPLKILSRDGTISSGSTIVNNSILDIKVFGARVGKYYKLGWYGNGTTAFGAPNYQMLFSEFDAATFATSSVTNKLDVIVLDDIASTSIEAGDIITRVFISTRVEALVFVVTYKPAAMPLGGNSVDMQSTIDGYGWSHIIDPATYSYTQSKAILPSALPVIPVALLPSSLEINAEKSFPLKLATRNSITSVENTLFKSGILDIKVVGVPKGYFVRLGWYGNGTLAFGAANYGMVFELVDATVYATSAVFESLVLHTNTDYDERIISGAIRTRTYNTTSRVGLAISITYNKAVFDPTLGSSVVANTSGMPGFSWIIDPACYVPEATKAEVVPLLVSVAPLVYLHTDSETKVAWRYSDTQDIRVSIGRYGVNNVNDIGEIALKTHGGLALSLSGTWTVMTTRSTDWIGPFIVNADAGGSGSTSQFTGANHGYTGGSGAPTAEQVYRRVYARGKLLISGDSGTADQLSFQWENLVQGSNTRDVPRYILREQHSFIVRPGSIETSARINALEALTVSTYYGLQAYIQGFNSTVHFLNGQQSARVAWADGLSSGAISDYPNAWAANIRGANGFNLLMWTDRSYGVANIANLAPTKDLFFTASNKAYTRMLDGGRPLTVAAGASFVWRGGYAMSPNLGVGIDYGTQYFDAGKETIVAVLTGAGAGRLALPTPDLAGKALTVRSGAIAFSGRVEPDGVAVSASQYAVGFATF